MRHICMYRHICAIICIYLYIHVHEVFLHIYICIYLYVHMYICEAYAIHDLKTPYLYIQENHEDSDNTGRAYISTLACLARIFFFGNSGMFTVY